MMKHHQALLLPALAAILPSSVAFVVQPLTQQLRRQPTTQLQLFDASITTTEAIPDVFVHAAGAPSVLVAAHQQEVVDAAAADGAISLMPAIGSSLIMLTIVGLLYVWEESVEWVREEIPKTLKPMVESILGEIGGLGFIGLILQSVLGNNDIKEGLEELSVRFFGEGDILVENFEFLHSAFFQVGVGYFIAAGGMVALGIKKLKEIESFQDLQFDEDTGTCTATANKLIQYLPQCVNQEQPGGITLWQDLTSPTEEKAARTVLIRNMVMQWFSHLPESFRVESYLQASFAYNLNKIVELSPLTWIYLIPGLALANAIDLSHDVINAASPNAAESAGFFFSTITAIAPSILTVTLATVWGIWNYCKLTEIKYMVLPRVGCDEGTGEVEVLPPFFESEAAVEAFDSSPAWVKPIENIWSKPATNEFEKLFGTAGGAGMKLYRNSIKYQTWLTLTQIVFFGTQIVPRDINVMLTGATATTVGDPDHLTAELITYGGFVALGLLQLSTLTTKTFWNFCIVAGADPKNRETILELSGGPPVPRIEATATPVNSTVVGVV